MIQIKLERESILHTEVHMEQRLLWVTSATLFSTMPLDCQIIINDIKNLMIF